MSDDIRVVVILTDANPELLAEFANVSPRARAERMRVLATLGLGFSRGGFVSHVQPQAEVTMQNPRPSLTGVEERPPRKRNLPTSLATEVVHDQQLPGQHDDVAMVQPLPDAESATKVKPRNSTLARFVKSLG